MDPRSKTPPQVDHVLGPERGWDRLADPSLIGAGVLRREDLRLLRGQGRFLADVQLPGMRELAFVRSPVAHGVLKSVAAPEGIAPGCFWTADSLRGIAAPMVAGLLRDAFRRAPYPALAEGRVRFAGEAIAAVIADSRAAAEDLAEAARVDIDPLPALSDAMDALAPGATRLHEAWADNNYLLVERASPGYAEAVAGADVHVTRHYRMARAGPMPIETRGCVAWFDRRNDQIVLWTSTQRPHLIRSFLAQHLGFDENRVRVIVPDVGGAFGVKTNFYPEELAVAAIATQLDHPVRWIETRSEHMLTACHAREQIQTITAHAMRDGTLVALEADIVGDGGAYSMITSTSAIEANMAVSVLLGPYRLKHYKFRARSAATNKTPMGPYRGVGRPGAVFAMERTIDELALVLGLPPNEVRAKNVITPAEFPYKTASGLTYDTGDYPSLIRLAEAAMRDRPAPQLAPGERAGIGYAMYVEQTAHGAAEFVARGSPVLYGFESARVKLDLSGSLTVEVGVLSQGQGLETTLAQIASAASGVPIARISVRQGDTDICPYGMGTVASRSMVKSGGAVFHACVKLADKLRAIAASQLGCQPSELKLAAGVAEYSGKSATYAQIADIAWQNVQKLPAGLEPGLEFLHNYRPEIETGTFASGMHAARVAVDADTGVVRLLDYLVVEDCGQEINPVIVEGQVRGGVVQGIGQALSEAFRFDEAGQPLAGSFMDYAVPIADGLPDIRIEHQHTLSSFGIFGMKGTGEGGAIAPPAAIANAVGDALSALNIGVAEAPVTSLAVWSALRRATAKGTDSKARTYIQSKPGNQEAP